MNHCPLCQSRDLEVAYRSNLPREPRSENHYECTSVALGIHPDVFRCRHCSFMFNEATRNHEDHLAEYASTEDPGYLELRASRRLTYGRELDRIEALCSGRDLLDVGCYAGFFMEQARERGWRVEGVEPSKWAADQSSRLGLSVFHGPIERYTTDRRFDVVTLWDVFEHLSDPVPVFQSIRGLLKQDGLLVFVTHNLDAPIARLLRGRYPFFMEMHTVHLNNRTRDLLLEKTGFALLQHLVHRRAIRIGYLLSRLRRLGEAPARWATRTARLLRVEDRILWIGFMGLETIFARRLEQL